MNLDYEKLHRLADDKYWNQGCTMRETVGEVIKQSGLLEEVERLRAELEIAKEIETKIGELVGDRGQYRDLVEAVEMRIHNLKGEL